MTVPRGEVFGFLGPNGAGKTTSVKLLLGLSRPSAGEARVLGAEVGDAAARRRIGYLPELFRYQSWMTAREVLALHCDLARIPRPDWQREIREALGLVGLAERADDLVGTFSKGMQQRLGVAQELVGSPRLGGERLQRLALVDRNRRGARRRAGELDLETVAGAQGRAEASCNLAQEEIAVVVTERVVDIFEPIDIEEHYRDLAPGAPRRTE